MLDALGIEIFEGDVIKSVESDPVHLICWSEYHASFVAVPVIESTSAFAQYLQNNGAGDPIKYFGQRFDHDWITEFQKTVIGNIHDNPELGSAN